MMVRVYRTFQVLSLDVVIGAVILLRFFCNQLQVEAGWEVYTLLGLAVWLIYTIDHLIDAESALDGSRLRYQFHAQHRKLLYLGIFLATLFSLALMLFIPVILFFGGLVLGFFSLIYLFVQYRLSGLFSKELYVAIVYTLGILMVPMLINGSISWDIFVLLFLLTFLNLITYSWYEREDDMKDGFHSLATRLTRGQLERLIMILLSIGMAIALLAFDAIHVYFICGFFLYSLMIIYPVWFAQKYRYRVVGDGVFLLPILFG